MILLFYNLSNYMFNAADFFHSASILVWEFFSLAHLGRGKVSTTVRSFFAVYFSPRLIGAANAKDFMAAVFDGTDTVKHHFPVQRSSIESCSIPSLIERGNQF